MTRAQLWTGVVSIQLSDVSAPLGASRYRRDREQIKVWLVRKTIKIHRGGIDLIARVLS